ncbi:MAG: cation-transporting P-type ATPase, partial [Ramlibacter sp.]
MSDAPAGLSASDAAARLRDEGPNSLPGHGPKPLARILGEILLEPMFL